MSTSHPHIQFALPTSSFVIEPLCDVWHMIYLSLIKFHLNSCCDWNFFCKFCICTIAVLLHEHLYHVLHIVHKVTSSFGSLVMCSILYIFYSQIWYLLTEYILVDVLCICFLQAVKGNICSTCLSCYSLLIFLLILDS